MSQEKIDATCSHTDTEIKGFFGPYRWLSNFQLGDVELKGFVFPSTENAYQFAKILEPKQEDFNKFTTCTPAEAKKYGRELDKTHKTRPDWQQVKFAVMSTLTEQKYTRPKNHELKAKLEATGNKHIEEANWWGDKYWGTTNGEGQNTLGKIIMQVRQNNRRGL